MGVPGRTGTRLGLSLGVVESGRGFLRVAFEVGGMVRRGEGRSNEGRVIRVVVVVDVFGPRVVRPV